jgi:predicted transcriptional regulator YheO
MGPYRLQPGDLVAGLAELLQDLLELVLHALAVQLLVLKVLGRQLDLRG